MTGLALTVKQPWASLIMAGVKDVENRGWPPPSTLPQWYRCNPCGDRVLRESPRFNADHDCSPAGTYWQDGPFPFRLWIHAGKQWDKRPWLERREGCGPMGRGEWLPGLPKGVGADEAHPFGALLGSVEVTDCHHAHDCDHICPEAGCDECDDPLGRCGHDAAWPAIDATGFAVPCDVRPGEACNNHCSGWAEDNCWHWTLTDPQPLDEPVPMKGRQRLWRLPEEVARAHPA